MYAFLYVPSVLLFSAQASASGLTQLASTSPASGMTSAVSPDGSTLWVAHGPSLVEIDLDSLHDSVDTEYDEVKSVSFEIEASIMDVIEYRGKRYVAGGDFGLFSVDRDGQVANEDATGEGRWCMDLDVTYDGHLVALWAALDHTEVRVYDLNDLASPPAVGQITTTEGLPRAGTGWALTVAGDFAYIAMGRAGLARVPWRNPTDVVVGPDFSNDPSVPSALSGTQASLQYRARDVAQVDGHLYVAAEALGLIDIDLALASWDVAMPYVVHPQGSGAYSVRVEAALDRSNDAVVVAIANGKEPSAKSDWGPYLPFTGFNSMLDNAEDVGEHEKANHSNISVYQRQPGALDLTFARNLAVDKDRWKSLSMTLEPDAVWLYDSNLRVWRSPRNGMALGSIEEHTTVEVPRVAYSDPITSLQDPNLVLSAVDGNASNVAMHHIDSQGEISISSHPEDGTALKLGIIIDAQWNQPNSSWEWVASQGWKLARFRADPNDPLRAQQTWQHWELERQADPLATFEWRHPAGRSYGPQAEDPRSEDGLLALATSQIPRSVSLYDRTTLYETVGEEPPVGSMLDLKPFARLDLHPELDSSAPLSDYDRIHTFRMEIFPWYDGESERAILAITAGTNPSSTHSNSLEPKVVFFDVTECTSAEDTCDVAFDPTATGNPGRVIKYLGGTGQAFGLDIATLAGHTYAFVGDSTGRITALELDDLFGVGPVERGVWQAPPVVFDGLTDPLTDVKAVEESGNLVLYVAANRSGFYRLPVNPIGNGDVTFDPPQQVNTPGQAASIHIVENAEAGRLLLVADHDDAGIKVYTER